jgi:hypothetical protein
LGELSGTCVGELFTALITSGEWDGVQLALRSTGHDGTGQLTLFVTVIGILNPSTTDTAVSKVQLRTECQAYVLTVIIIRGTSTRKRPLAKSHRRDALEEVGINK